MIIVKMYNLWNLWIKKKELHSSLSSLHPLFRDFDHYDPILFLIQLPEFENEIMTKDYRNMQEQMKFQKEHFAVDIEMAKQISAKYDLPNQDIDRVNIRSRTLLSEMEKPYLNDTTWSGKMYRNIVKSYSDFKKSKKNDVLQKDKEVKECKQNLEKS